jgi:DNA polymerase III delta prime subunit
LILKVLICPVPENKISYLKKYVNKKDLHCIHFELYFCFILNLIFNREKKMTTTIKPSQLKEAVRLAIENKHPLLVVGQPGIGKTAIIDQVARELDNNIEPLFPAIADPTVFMGMPYYDEENKEALFLPFGNMKRLITAESPTVCHIEDIGQSEPSTMKAFLHFVHARSVGNYSLSPHVTIIACTNDRSHNAGVLGMIEPLKSRFKTILHLRVDVEDWIRWAIRANIRPEVIGFVRLRGMDVLSNFTPTMELTNSPSPRGNESVSDILNLGIDDPTLEFAEIEGACGHGYAIEFLGFKKLFDSLVDPRYILTHPEKVDIPQNNPSVLFAYCSAVSRLAEPDNMDAVVRFARRLPIEFQVRLLQFDCKSANPENHETRAYTDWTIDNQALFAAA